MANYLARSIYERYIGDLLATNPNLLVSLVYFVIVIAGLVFFAIYPALEKNSIGYAIFAGALFDLMSYATYTVVN